MKPSQGILSRKISRFFKKFFSRKIPGAVALWDPPVQLLFGVPSARQFRNSMTEGIQQSAFSWILLEVGRNYSDRFLHLPNPFLLRVSKTFLPTTLFIPSHFNIQDYDEKTKDWKLQSHQECSQCLLGFQMFGFNPTVTRELSHQSNLTSCQFALSNLPTGLAIPLLANQCPWNGQDKPKCIYFMEGGPWC